MLDKSVPYFEHANEHYPKTLRCLEAWVFRYRPRTVA